jgi:hypothetical protein
VDSSGFSAVTFISDARIAELEARGKQARRECRSRVPAVGTFSAIETKAYQRGWDWEQAAVTLLSEGGGKG